MNKKGFTLVEMLAAVAILGILSALTTLAVSRILDGARKKEFKEQEKQLTNLALTIYTHEKLSRKNMSGGNMFLNKYKGSEDFYIKDEDLIGAGYLEEKIKSPKGNGATCDSYIEFKYNNSSKNFDVQGYIKCVGVDETSGYSDPNTELLKWHGSEWVEG